MVANIVGVCYRCGFRVENMNGYGWWYCGNSVGPNGEHCNARNRTAPEGTFEAELEKEKTVEVDEPPIVAKVRELLKLRERKFENGGPHTATFTIYNTISYCFIRIGETWSILGHRYTGTTSRGNPIPDQGMDEMFDFNAIGVTSDLKSYPSGFVHTNCMSLADALRGLGFLTVEEAKAFKSWSHRMSAAEEYGRAKARFHAAMLGDK